MNYQDNTPDTAVSVLELFNPSKEGIVSFASKVINDVSDGKVDPLRVRLLCNALIDIAGKIDKGTKEQQEKEAAKYGEKIFSFMGADMQYCPTYTVYDYSHCNDRVYESLKEKADLANAALKDRETLLKVLKESQDMLDADTGEVYRVHPAIKKQTMGVKVTIK